MKGIRNIGNSCYLNSALQMFMQNIQLCNLIIHFSKYSSKLDILKNFIYDYHNNTTPLESTNESFIYDIINPIEIKELIDDRNNFFLGDYQHDSTEFIIFLLDIIDTEIKNIIKSNQFDDVDYLKQIYGFTINNIIKCKRKTCLNIINTDITDLILILNIDSDSNNLDQIYDKTYCKEIFTDDNKYFCDKCNKLTIASKKTNVISCSNNLLIFIKRFSNLHNQHIDIPLEWKFDTYLQGAIIHYGNNSGGHYIYVGKHNDEWYIYNDSNISKINLNKLNKILAFSYCLYYKKKN